MEPLRRETTETILIRCRTTIAEIETAMAKLRAAGVPTHRELFVGVTGPFELTLRDTQTRSDYDKTEVVA
jgi:hypothetical protein